METAGQVIHMPVAGLKARHKTGGGPYAYTRKDFVKRGQAHRCVVSVYEIPPGKSAYPYHYHCQSEEVFYILGGSGTLRTPEGERPVAAGELLFFPAGAGGAHKLTNHGQEPLVYIDFDTAQALDAAVYPDSGKIGLWGMGVNQVFRQGDAVDYYEGE
ncbi:cupin domain-containing protein [Acutalibacter caecimuris]|uniref:cupin domain-containing protein n=1 Tax=Acutalibacter caecimuris TaxID=3093657 RepID=UPI002AC96089|nr:cupin domain-containing protein [Acutalibacter sp. M00118]